MKHAIIETGGKQYRVAEGDVIFVEKLCAEAGETVKFDRVLAVIDEDTTVRSFAQELRTNQVYYRLNQGF